MGLWVVFRLGCYQPHLAGENYEQPAQVGEGLIVKMADMELDGEELDARALKRNPRLQKERVSPFAMRGLELGKFHSH